ncbi:MAG: penicillin acylase family protein, partial [Acidobacteriota bacterium]|nr:penicillin acylase family protein [Acidobacteriota bacterium]
MNWRRFLRIAGVLVLVVLLVVAGLFLWLRGRVHGSLPQLDGSLEAVGISQPVQVDRDAAGVPTIRAVDRVDAMGALGFVHGQDRFFQMDLQRRQAAGELAELIGAAAVDADRQSRFHRFRSRARERVAELPEVHRQVLLAYTDGVNSGLQRLGPPPPEYLLLRQTPRPWQPEDSFLTLYAMYFQLQGSRGSIERQRDLLRTELPLPLAEFLLPVGTAWDAALDDSAVVIAEIPPASVFDLRQPGYVRHDRSPGTKATDEFELPAALGSNAFAVSDQVGADGHAWLAGDMHLGHSMPNIWYRTVLEYDDPEPRRVAGVTLPGVPAIVAGSNGDVAWAFTNSQGDWLDIVKIEFATDDRDRYRAGDKFEDVESFDEVITVHDGEPVTLTVRETRWGPILRQDEGGVGEAIHWMAHQPQGANLQLIEMASARDLDQALAVANRCGIPAQNLNVVDRSGRAGWAIAGPIPRRVGGLDGVTPRFWSPDGPRWDGILGEDEAPSWVDPPGGRIWTANNRVIGGESLQKIGDEFLVVGARAAQIRDGLRARAVVGAKDLLAIQLDDRALFLDRWRTLLLDLLNDAAVT